MKRFAALREIAIDALIWALHQKAAIGRTNDGVVPGLRRRPSIGVCCLLGSSKLDPAMVQTILS